MAFHHDGEHVSDSDTTSYEDGLDRHFIDLGPSPDREPPASLSDPSSDTESERDTGDGPEETSQQMAVRAYQQEMLEESLKENIIVVVWLSLWTFEVLVTEILTQ